jgi:hypothetical protein
VFFRLSSVTLAVVIVGIIGGAAVVGTAIGRHRRERGDVEHQSFGVIQGALLGLVGLLLAFGLSMSVGRYDARRAIVVQEANDIGTAYLRAELLAEPMRSTSLELLQQYTDHAIALAEQVPDSAGFDREVAAISELQRSLWGLGGDAVRADPVGSAPRLYVEALNPMFDSNSTRLAAVRNRVPTTVLALQVFGSAIAIGVLALYLALIGRNGYTALAAALVLVLILFISFDLDRPHRGLITVPDAPLVSVRAMMVPPPAAEGP